MNNDRPPISTNSQTPHDLANGISRRNLRAAKRMFGQAPRAHLITQLKALSRDYEFSIDEGELKIVDGNWYVTHTGLLRLARRKRCRGIHVEAVDSLCDSAAARYVLKATVYPFKNSSGFVGYGDADPYNVSSLVRGAEMRIAETRAVNRALRKAYGIGICSVEEIGSYPTAGESRSESPKVRPKGTCSKDDGNRESGKRNANGHQVRDRLCQIIRQYKLDPELVKGFAVDFCGTNTLKETSREQVEKFVEHLADLAGKDRDALLCQLNSYARPTREVIA
jgi:hypothetical protein